MNQFTLSGTADVIIGAGIAKLNDLKIAGILIGAGIVLKIIVALLQKNGVPISARL